MTHCTGASVRQRLYDEEGRRTEEQIVCIL